MPIALMCLVGFAMWAVVLVLAGRKPIQTPVTEYHDGSRSWHHGAAESWCHKLPNKVI
jgi:hypothetical protein